MKRARLANELVSRPSLLFLDEVTSGLDEQSDREVMELFREVADGGKTVVCITHSLANVEATCHLVVILTEGGRLAFVGTPTEAKDYFSISRLGDVYRKMAEQTPETWHERFRSSPYFRRYVVERLPADTPYERPLLTSVRPVPRGASGLRQAEILTRRYLTIWRGDRLALLAMVAHAELTRSTIPPGPLLRRAVALRRKSWGAVFQRQRDPDAAGRARPRAPTAAPGGRLTSLAA